MKKIRIFLASSIEDLKLDRIEVGDFFLKLNAIYLDRGIHFLLERCEDEDQSISTEGTQSRLDGKIRDSVLVFFLFFKKVGDYTKHEFEVALESFRQKNSPKIVTYIKYVNSIEEVNDEVGEFMKMLDTELGHYYNTYGNIDTLKLGILMQIKNMGLDKSVFEINNGRISIDGNEIEDCDCYNIPMFSGNTEMQELRKELEGLDAQYYELRKQTILDPDDNDTYIKYFDIAAERRETKKKLREIEMKMLHASGKMFSDRLSGGLSERQKDGYRLFERGDYDGALQILDFDEICSDIDYYGTFRERDDAFIQRGVDELTQRIEILSAKGYTKETVPQIKKSYEKACRTVEKYNLEKKIMNEYIVFLMAHNEFYEAIEIGERLRYYYEDPRETISDYDKAILSATFGQLYMYTQRYDEAEKEYLDSTEIFEQLVEKEPGEHNVQLAALYQDLSAFYAQRNSRKESKLYIKKAIETIMKDKGAYTEEEKRILGHLFINMGISYMNDIKVKEAEESFLQAADIFTKLSEKNSVKYEPMLIVAYGNLVTAYNLSEQHDKAEQPMRKSLEICERLAADDPEMYETSLFTQYTNLAGYYMRPGSYDKAAKPCLKALKKAERLFMKNPEAYESYLAMSYSLCGGLFMCKERYDDAEIAIDKAMEINIRLARKTPDVYAGRISEDYVRLGMIYSAQNRKEEAEDAMNRANEVLALLNKTKDNTFETELEALGFLSDLIKSQW